MRVYFENNKWAELSQDQLNLHIKMQKVYNNIEKEREDFADELKERAAKRYIYRPDLDQKDQEEYRAFLKQLELRLDFCFKYDQTSLLPPLSVKIKEVRS